MTIAWIIVFLRFCSLANDGATGEEKINVSQEFFNGMIFCNILKGGYCKLLYTKLL